MNLIHYISHNFSDWDSQTKYMSRLEQSLFLDLRTLYFANATASNGKIDASDFDMLCWRLACRTDDEKQALQQVLKAKFKKVGNTYRHADWDKQIKAIMWAIKSGNAGNESGNDFGNVGNENGNAMSGAERTAKAKAERKDLLAKLADIGVKPNKNIAIDDLRTLYKAHFGNDVGNTSGNVGNTGGNESGNAGNAQKSPNKPLTNNHKPLNQYESENATHPLSQNQTATTAKQKAELSTPAAKKTKFDPKAYPIGDSVDPDLWADFCDMRKAIKKPLTEFACKQLVKDFNDWADEGLSTNRAIAESIKNSWQGVFRDRAIVKQVSKTTDPLAVNDYWTNQYQPPPTPTDEEIHAFLNPDSTTNQPRYMEI